jgi:hypothetical protein
MMMMMIIIIVKKNCILKLEARGLGIIDISRETPGRQCP